MEALAGVLDRLLARLGLDEALHGWEAVEEWPRVVGPQIANRTRALGFQDGVLRVAVEGSAWMHELGYLRRDIIQRLNQALGADRVRDVKFVIPRKGVLR